MSDDNLTIEVFEQDGMVIFEAETDDAAIALPLDPDVAEGLAVRLMIAVEEARRATGVDRGRAS